MRRHGVITEKCIDTLRNKGTEEIPLSNGDVLVLHYSAPIAASVPGTRGEGCYIYESPATDHDD